MTKRISTILSFLCGLLIAAHFFRSGSILLVLLGLAFPFLLLAGKTWAVRTVQCCLGLASLVWVVTLVDIARVRLATGEPWIRMAAILGVVALLNAGAAVGVGRKG